MTNLRLIAVCAAVMAFGLAVSIGMWNLERWFAWEIDFGPRVDRRIDSMERRISAIERRHESSSDGSKPEVTHD